MEYRYLGRTGLKVSDLCLGTMTFGREIDEAASHELLNTFVDAGGNFIDTADVYSEGESEKMVGTWLKNQNRSDFIVATKVRFGMGDGPNDIGLSRNHILNGVEASLKRLDTDYIDLYQVHCWDPGTPLEETLRTLDSLVKSGKVRYIGVSNYTGWQLQKAIDMSRQLNVEAFVSLQPLYNLLDRTLEHELIPVCLNEGIGVIPWSPLRGGWLSGKYRRGEKPPEGTRIEIADEKGWMEGWSNYATDRNWDIIETLIEVAEEVEKSPAQVAINWLMHRPAVTAPIVGAHKLTHLQDNLGASGWQLSAEQHERLDAISTPPSHYPYDFITQLGNLRRV